MVTKKKRRGRRRGKRKGERTLAQIVALFPAQMIEVRKRAIEWGISVEELLTWNCPEFNRKRENP